MARSDFLCTSDSQVLKVVSSLDYPVSRRGFCVENMLCVQISPASVPVQMPDYAMLVS